jgi:hypothetical protein
VHDQDSASLVENCFGDVHGEEEGGWWIGEMEPGMMAGDKEQGISYI